MAKRKSGKHQKPATFNQKKTISEKDNVNPFELRVNRQRHNVLGRKFNSDKGKPGVSRNKAIKKRMEIFQKCSRLTKKSNNFVDRRIGEYDDPVLKEDLIVERITQARKKKYKKNIYNLNDDEALTHYGQPVMELDKFDAPADDSEDDEDDDGNLLGEEFLDKAHFGGFLTKKTETESPKTHKEILGELILENKKKKEERKAERELNDNLTEKLDKEWKEVLSVVSGLKRKDDETHGKSDSYDVTVNELKFEPRGATAASLIKTKEQIENEERARLRKLEEERHTRMKEDYEKGESKQENLEMSADSIYDGLAIEKEFDGRSDTSLNEQEGDDASLEEAGSDDDDQDSNDSEAKCTDGLEDDVKTNDFGPSNVPLTIKSLSELLSDKSNDEISTILEKIISDNHPSRGPEKTKILQKFFKVLLVFITENCWASNMESIDVLVTHLYALTKFGPLEMGQLFKKYMLKKLSHCGTVATNSMNNISLDILISLKLCAILYPTSDFRHPIVTPAMLYMCDMLTSSYKVTLPNILSRLFVSCLFYEYVSFSRRFATEPVNFLCYLLYLAAKDLPSTTANIPRHVKKNKHFLLVDELIVTAPQKIGLHLLKHPVEYENEPELKVSIIFAAVFQLNKFAELYKESTAFHELFHQAHILCECLPVQLYPAKLASAIQSFKTFFAQKPVKTHLCFPKKKPQLLKLLEPSFEINLNDKNLTVGKQLRIEKQLSKKIKKAEKGVIREIRRDSQFVAWRQLQDKLEADAERKRKVKELYHLLSEQEGEYKKFTRKK